MHQRVLVCASTNVAVDRVLESLLAKEYTAFYRVGSVKKIGRPILPHTLTETNVLGDLRELRRDATLSAAERAIVEREIVRRRSGAAETRRAMLRAAPVVGVTCASSTNPLLGDAFDVVLFDEATQTIEPLALLPLVRFRPRAVVCVGDPMQLDPVLQREHDAATLFQRVLPANPPILLNTQYRCHPAISGVVNRMYYDRRLVDGENVAGHTSLIPGAANVVLCYHDDEGERAVDGSYESPFEITVVQELIAQLAALGVPLRDVGVMSFYRRQCEELARTLTARDATVATVDAFQGAERDVVILSFVRSQESTFIDSAKRLNVALTRARRNVVLVLHRSFLGHAFMQRLLHGAVVSYVDGEMLVTTHRLLIEK